MEYQRLFEWRHFQVEIMLMYMRVFRESTQEQFANAVHMAVISYVAPCNARLEAAASCLFVDISSITQGPAE